MTSYLLMAWANYFVAFVCAMGFGAMLCRVQSMSWRTHQPLVVAFHLALCLACLWGLYRAWSGAAGLGDLCSAIAALCWVALSYPTWSAGPPTHTETAPMPLDPLEHTVGPK